MRSDFAISSVMLCFNRLELSRLCLDSYLATVTVPHELIVVNNGSTDGTREWAESLRGRPEINVVIQQNENDPASALNTGLARCSGEILHVMENDFEYLTGWDQYAIDAFARVCQLGQLGVPLAPLALRGEERDGLYLSKRNVACSSFLRRTVFFEDGVRFRNHYGSYPNDFDLSDQIRRAGWLIAWPASLLAVNHGHSDSEFARSPAYYIRNYHLKLSDAGRWRVLLHKLSRGDTSSVWVFRNQIGSLLKLYRYWIGNKLRGR